MGHSHQTVNLNFPPLAPCHLILISPLPLLFCTEVDYEEKVTFGEGQTRASVALPLTDSSPDSFSAALTATQPAVVTGERHIATVTVLRSEPSNN